MKSLWVVILAFLLPVGARGEQQVAYRVEYHTPGAPRAHIGITLAEARVGSQVLVIPRAIPMGYGEQYFDRYISDVRAFDGDGKFLQVSKIDGPRWNVGQPDKALQRIEYEIDIARMEREILSAADSSKVRTGYVGLLGYTIFGYVVGFEERGIHLRIEAPRGWPILSTLDPRQPCPTGAAEVQAHNFYALADSQILAGTDWQLRRLDGPVPLYLAVYAEGGVDLAILGRLAEEAFRRVCVYFHEIPFPHYTIVQELLKPLSDRHEYGFSMEHLESGTFFLSLDRAVTAESEAAALARTRYNFAHHIAHAWIPKRAYGEGYYPFSWDRAPSLDSIWFSEGFPQYAAIEALADAADDRSFKEEMLESRFRRNLGEAPEFIRKMSLVELSRTASTRYSEDFRLGRNVFSRGGLMAAEMDARIRETSGGTKRLRDALRHLVAWSARNGRAFRIDELPAIFEEATGVETRDILEKWLAPPEP